MTGHSGVPIRGTLREKLPEILLEAGSVLFALLLAFAVDEWRENRANAALAARARASIEAEIRANQAELRGSYPGHAKMLADIPGQLEQLDQVQRGTVAHGSINVNINVSQLSTAAWQTAQTTQATQFMDYEWVLQVARLYELQRLYAATQDDVVSYMSDMKDNPGPTLRRVQGKLNVLQTLGDALLRAYEKQLSPAQTPAQAPAK